MMTFSNDTTINMLKLPIHKKLFLGAIIFAIVFNGVQSTLELKKLITARKASPFFFSGLKVAGMQPLFKNENKIGYYTDRDIENNPKALAEFAQFQLELAPAILDNDNLDHRFLILDCENPVNALKKIQQLDAKALRRNNLGMIIAIREKF